MSKTLSLDTGLSIDALEQKESFLKSLGSACHKIMLRRVSDCKEEAELPFIEGKESSRLLHLQKRLSTF